MARRLACGAVLVLALSACSTDSSSSEAPSEPGAVSPSALSTEPASTDPTDTGEGAACTPPELCGEELAPGEYASAVGATGMTFTVGEGWRGTEYGDLGFDLVRADVDLPQVVSAAPYAGVVYADVCSGAETENVGATAADFVTFIADRPGITARGDATEVTIGDRTGLQIDVDAADPGCVSEPPDRLWLWDLAGQTDFHLNVGEAARLVALDGDDGVIVFVIETFDPAQFDALLELTQPVLDSIVFG